MSKDEKFVVDNDHKANWALKKIRKLEEEKAKNKDFAEQEIAEIKEWLAAENKTLDNKIDFFEALLTEYALNLKEKDEEFKTKSLPAGKLQFRKQRAKWKYDQEQLLASVKEMGLDELVKTKQSVNKRELKKKIEVKDGKAINAVTGEIIEGIQVINRGEKFKININERN